MPFAICKIALCSDHFNDRERRVGSLSLRRVEGLIVDVRQPYDPRWPGVWDLCHRDWWRVSSASTGPDTSVSPSWFAGPDPYASRGTPRISAISALSAHRLQRSASLARRRRGRGRGIGIDTRGQRDSPRASQNRAGPDGRRSIEKFRVCELLALSREPPSAAPCSRERARECVRNLSDIAGQKCSTWLHMSVLSISLAS